MSEATRVELPRHVFHHLQMKEQQPEQVPLRYLFDEHPEHHIIKYGQLQTKCWEVMRGKGKRKRKLLTIYHNFP